MLLDREPHCLHARFARGVQLRVATLPDFVGGQCLDGLMCACARAGV